MPKEILTNASEGRKNVKLLIVIGVVVVAVAFFGLMELFPKIDPMAQFITQKSCSFLVMPDVSRAICTDGTAYDVVQVGYPSPLP
jgi:hypothetical protein